MTRPPDRPTSSADKSLTPQNLLADFGARAAMTRQSVRTLLDALAAGDRSALQPWRRWLDRWIGQAVDKLPPCLAPMAQRYGVAAQTGESLTLLFALQTYYATLVALLAEQFGHGRTDEDMTGERRIDEGMTDHPFSWPRSSRWKSVGRLIERLREALADYRPTPAGDDGGNTGGNTGGNNDGDNDGDNDGTSDGDCDLFKPLYQNLFPRALRHRLGEYYTPDWLAAHVLDQVGYTGEPGCRLLDPACGSGTFLLMALRRVKSGEWRVKSGEGRVESGEWRVESGEWRGERGEGKGKRDQATENGRSEMVNRESDIELGRYVSCPSPLSTLHSPLSTASGLPPLVGFDINPLAVMTARANCLIALANVLPEHDRVEVHISLRDSIFESGEADAADFREFDFVVGNPPWIAWDNLPPDYRRATKPLWERYGLFSLSGNEARHGGGKKDLSMLMLYAAADRYLKPGGRLGLVITQTVFQSQGAGDGFRRFRLGADGPPLGVLRVDDMTALRPFDGAANWTSTIALQKGVATAYPVPYFVWSKRREADRGKRDGKEAECGRVSEACSACPIDPAKPTSPWQIEKRGQNYFSAKEGEKNSSDPFYTAHLGANSGGANGVYWVDVLGRQDGGALVRNATAKCKRRVETVEQVIEPELLYPLLRWGDVQRYAAVPRGHILLVQDPVTRTGIDEAVMRKRFPRTLEYLERFRDVLVSRAAYRRYQQRGPFYSMYNVGPYTIAPVRVVWRRMDRQINAAVVETAERGGDGDCEPRPAVPQETCVLAACDSVDEAHYVCAVLNSAAIDELAASHGVRGGKSFGTPGMFARLPIARYRPDDPRHVELSALSRRAHAVSLAFALENARRKASQAKTSPVAELQRRMDELVAALTKC